MGVEPIITTVLAAKSVEKGIPLSGTFEISPCCNLSCRMCYVRKTKEEVEEAGGEIDADTWLEIAEECKRAGMLFLLLTGGEPFLYRDFKKLYSGLCKMGFMITINSNGTLIDENMVDFLKNNPPTRVNITLYGGNGETYKKLCNNSDGFYKAQRAVKLLKEAGISVMVNASMTPYNIDDMEEIFEFGRANNVHVQAATYMFPPVRRNKNLIGKGDRFTYVEAARNQFNIDKILFTKEQFAERTRAYKNRIKETKLNDESCLVCEDENLRCRAGKCAFWINWRGKMTACGMFNEPSINVLDEGFNYAWQKIRKTTSEIYMPKKCSSCELKNICDVCGAMVVTETGDFKEPPEYICKMTREKIRLYEEEYNKNVNLEGENNGNKEGVH